MKKYIVKVLVNQPIYVDYLVEAETAEEAQENYEGFPVIDENEGDSLEDYVMEVTEYEG